MKKIFMTPDVRVIRFDSKDIVTTSVDSPEYGGGTNDGKVTEAGTQARQSIWD